MNANDFARVFRAHHAFAGTFPVMERVNKRLEDMKLSVRPQTNSQERGQPTVFSIGVHPRSLGPSNSLTASSVRRSRREEAEIIYRNSLLAGKLFWGLAPISFGDRA